MKEPLAAGAMPHAGRVVAELRLRYPAFDLREGKLEKDPDPLPGALYSEGKYCASVTIDELFTDSMLCAPLTKDPADEDFSDQSYSSGLLDGRTELPAGGYINTVSGLFTYDVATQTVTAMDELALQNVPQGTVSVTELQTALARAEAERVLFFEKYGPRGGGDFPLFGGSADERATHEAEVASLLAETSADDASASNGPALAGTTGAAVQEQTSGTAEGAGSSTEPSAANRAGAVAGVVVLLALVVSIGVAAVRRRSAAGE